jgi:HK97 family phage portal protein
MGIFDFFRRPEPGPTEASLPAIYTMAGEAATFRGFDDPAFKEWIRSGGGGQTESGISVSVSDALRNPTVIRCVSLISFAIATLPFHLRDKPTKQKATDHPLFRVLHRKPNAWQTAFEFRSLMQQRALTDGNAYALIVRSRGRVTQLVPLDRGQVKPRQLNDWSVVYDYTRPTGGTVTLQSEEVFHLRYGLSDDGICGLSLVKQSAEALALAIQTEKAAARLFRQGMLVGGVLKHPAKLSPEAYERLKASMAQKESAENAHKWLITEEGMDATPFSMTAENSQHLEQRKHQIEELARPYGVPRPLLGVDDTSWGSGIDVLGQFFVRYGLNPWFEAWQQAVERSLLTDAEADQYEAKFNEGALLRGSMSDQADFFAKALGSGGHQPWMEYEEVRETMDLPAKDIEPNPLANRGTPPESEGDNEPA